MSITTQPTNRIVDQGASTTFSVSVNGKPIIRVADPLMSFVTIVRRLRGTSPSPQSNRIHPTAIVHASASIGENTDVGPYAVIGEGVKIGNRCSTSRYQ